MHLRLLQDAAFASTPLLARVREALPARAPPNAVQPGDAGQPAMRPLGTGPSTPQREDLTPSDAEVVPLTAPRLLPATDSRFKGLKAFVAGAAGRTGRRVVARLVEEGVPVRALVRNAIKAVRAVVFFFHSSMLRHRGNGHCGMSGGGVAGTGQKR